MDRHLHRARDHKERRVCGKEGGGRGATRLWQISLLTTLSVNVTIANADVLQQSQAYRHLQVTVLVTYLKTCYPYLFGLRGCV